MALSQLISRKKLGTLLGLLLIYCLPLLTVVGASDIFLKVGDIKGESVDEQYKEWIKTESTQFGMTRPVQSGKTGSSGPPNFSDFFIEKPTDSSSPLLLKEGTSQQPRDVTLEYVRGTFERQRFYRVKLYDALVSGFAFSALGDEPPQEKVGFNFLKMEMTYTEWFKGQPSFENTAWYDLAQNKAGLTTTIGNTAPTISTINPVATSEDTPVTVNFTIGDAEKSPEYLTLSATTSNSALAPVSGMTFGGSGSNRSVTIRPATNQFGSATITIHVSDGALSASRAFSLTVNAVNDAPTISVISGKTTDVNVPITVDFQINDVDNDVNSLILTAQSSVQSLVSDGNITFGGSGSSRSATITPSPGQTGDTTIALTVSDGLLQSSSVFVLSVLQHTPQAPTDILLSNSSVPENSPNGTLIGTLTATDPDSTNHEFTLLDSAGGRFRIQANQLQVNDGSLLDFEADETHTILVKATDAEELFFSKNLVIQIVNVNESPEFLIVDDSIIETVAGMDTPILRLQLADPDAGINPLTLTLGVANGVLNISTNFTGTISSNGTAEVTLSGSLPELNSLLSSTDGLIYRAIANASGTDILSATLNDNGHNGLGTNNIVYTILGIEFFASQYQKWLYDNFTPSELENPELEATVWGPKADPDNDGLENLAEYALGTSPRDPNAKPAAFFVEKDGKEYLSLQMNLRKDPNLSLSVEVAAEVNQTWSSAPEDLETFEPIDLENGFEEVRFDDRTATSETTHRFMRMRWTLQQE